MAGAAGQNFTLVYKIDGVTVFTDDGANTTTSYIFTEQYTPEKRAGYIFDCWYSDETYTNKVETGADISDINGITTTIYGRYVSIDSSVVNVSNIDRVVYNNEDCSEIVYDDVTVWPLSKAGYDYVDNIRYKNIIEGDDSVDYWKEYFTIITLKNGTIKIWGTPYRNGWISYSYDKSNWTKTNVTANTEFTINIPSQKNIPVYIKGNGDFNNVSSDGKTVNRVSIHCDVKFYVRGNLYSYNRENVSSSPNSYDYPYLFKSASNLVGAKYLKIPLNNSGSGYGYANMFELCTSLRTLPIEIKAYSSNVSTTNKKLFYLMFNGCSSLVDIHETVIRVPHKTGVDQSFEAFCSNCKNLEYGPKIIADGPYGSTGNVRLFRNCPKLKWVMDTHTSFPNSMISTYLENNTVENGIFVKNINLKSLPTGLVPSSWTILNYNVSTGKFYLADKTTECDWQGNPI